MTDEPTIHLRRDPLRAVDGPADADDPDCVAGEPELVARIRAEIASGGPISVARFMERALYEPGLGYYRRSAPGPGRAGDFLTAPETHPVFGATLGRVAEAVWGRLGRPDPFAVLEIGAGTGALAVGLLDGLRRARSPLLAAIRYVAQDIEPARVVAARERLDAAGLGDHVEPPGTATKPSLVIANEVLDALPVHRVVRRGSELRERLVDVTDDGFVEIDGPPARPELVDRLEHEGVRLADGQLAEICLDIDAWVRATTIGLDRGVLVVIDYGAEAADLYRPTRPEGTLRGFHRHRLVDDPYRRVGRQDLTAHVDLTALREAARRAGLQPMGTTTQARLLAALAGDLVAERLHDPATDLRAALELRSALARLLDPRGMGGFAVVAFGRGAGTDPLPGFDPLDGGTG